MKAKTLNMWLKVLWCCESFKINKNFWPWHLRRSQHSWLCFDGCCIPTQQCLLQRYISLCNCINDANCPCNIHINYYAYTIYACEYLVWKDILQNLDLEYPTSVRYELKLWLSVWSILYIQKFHCYMSPYMEAWVKKPRLNH